MSTYIYLLCLDHDPPLQAEDESGQHLYDLPRIRAEIADREALAERRYDLTTEYQRIGSQDPRSGEVYFASHSAAFLAQHLTCRIGIRDEYGREHPIREEGDRG